MSNTKPFIIFFLLISSLSYTGFAEAISMDEHVYIIPAGDDVENIDISVLGKLREDLPGAWPVRLKAEIDAPQPINPASYDPSPGQYNADVIMDDVYNRVTIDVKNERVLIVTDVDLYVPGVNFVYGGANAKKGIAIISLMRLKEDNPDKRLLSNRVLREAVRELGRSRGLEDCPNPKCVMYFSENLSDTDGKRVRFCYSCGRKLDRNYESPLFNVDLL